MRRTALVLCLILVAAACGDDDAATTTTTSTSAATSSTTTTSTTSSTTSTSTTMAPPPEAIADRCVMGLSAGDMADVRSGAGDDTDLLGQLPYDANGIGVTGITATNASDEEWTEIVFEGAAGWVRTQYLTEGECATGDADTWAVIDIVCGSIVNVRNGQGDGYDILGTLEPDAFDLVGTGVTALDDMDRTWVQIEFDGGAAWVAGWFLTTDPGPTIDCSIPDFPWIITADAVGPIELGDPGADLEEVTGLSFYLQNSYNTCEWFNDVDDRIGVEVTGGTITEIWVFDGAIAETVEGFSVGQSKAEAGLAYPGRAVLLPGPIVPTITNVVIDGVTYGADWTYLFTEDPFDEDLVGTIRINDGGGYIEGGCT